jgi:hypothetical protein
MFQARRQKVTDTYKEREKAEGMKIEGLHYMLHTMHPTLKLLHKDRGRGERED